jgi:hypothetical protein
MKSQGAPTIRDEFAFVLLAALIFIAIMLIYWTTPQEAPPYLEPRSISVKMFPNSEKIVTFKIKGLLTNVNLAANGSLSQLISFSENNFAVSGEKDVKAILMSPSYGRYSGYIIARGKGGEDAIEVVVDVVPTLTLVSRSIPIEDFKISNYGGEKIVASKSDFSVERSLFSSKSAKLTFTLEKLEVEDAKLKIIVEESKGPGYLVIKLNGNVIYRKKVSDAHIEEIPLNVSYLKEVNFIQIEAESEGFEAFFKTAYHIFNAEVKVRYKSTPYSFQINLSQHEIDNFYALEFSSILVQQNYPTVEIKVNNQKVYFGKLPIVAFKQNITRDLMGNALLLLPSNNISISLVTEGEIYFSNNIVKIYSYSS